jgi:hypothetical protein
MTDLSILASKLSEAQKRAILDARWVGSGLSQMCVVDYTDPWTVPIVEFLTLRTDRLTPLGLSLRSYLKGMEE